MRNIKDFLEKEKDAELQRWRSTERPHYVVYLSDQFKSGNPYGSIIIFNETTGISVHANRDSVENGYGETVHAVHAEFFAEHPKIDPKPWHEAKEGEYWTLDLDGYSGLGTMLAKVEEGHRVKNESKLAFVIVSEPSGPGHVDVEAPAIQAATRVPLGRSDK